MKTYETSPGKKSFFTCSGLTCKFFSTRSVSEYLIRIKNNTESARCPWLTSTACLLRSRSATRCSSAVINSPCSTCRNFRSRGIRAIAKCATARRMPSRSSRWPPRSSSARKGCRPAIVEGKSGRQRECAAVGSLGKGSTYYGQAPVGAGTAVLVALRWLRRGAASQEPGPARRRFARRKARKSKHQ
jgi:hypothetical protein